MPSLARISLLATALALLCSPAALATVTDTDELVVYGKKPAESLQRSAETVSIVTGEELRSRGARDLASALSMVPGVQIAPGGDGGPASSVPAFQGLREFDAFLLLVDGVPLGAAYTPLLTGLSMLGVERIEVIKGAAPVGFGATSFVGVINIVHYAAGEAPEAVSLGAGSRDGRAAALVWDLPRAGGSNGWKQSLMLEARGQDGSVDRSKDATLHALYRGATTVGRTALGMDMELQAVDQDPASPHPREGQDLSSRFPRDANVNPGDARLDEDRARLSLHASTPTALGEWDTRLALTRITDHTIRGFLREDFAEDGITTNADGYAQTVRRDEWYLDSHLSHPLAAGMMLVAGVDWIGGDGEQNSRNSEYAVLPDGSNAPPHASLPVDESTTLENERDIAGAYADLDIELSPRWRVELGARYSLVDDRQYGLEEPADGAGTGERDSRSDQRWSGAVESGYSLWESGGDYLTLYGSYRNTFKPAVVDFGPEAESRILKPENTEGLEIGLRGKFLDERLRVGASTFNTSFHNLVVSQPVNGLPSKVNAGDTTLEGYELEAQWQLLPSLQLTANWSHHAARFDDYAQLFGGNLQQLRGNYLEMSPKTLAGVGIRYEPAAQGFRAWLMANRSGEFYLNKRNTARRDGYNTVDAGIGLRLGNWDLRLDGSNLSDRRDPVTESELGDAQYYRLPERSVWFSVDLRLGTGA